MSGFLSGIGNLISPLASFSSILTGGAAPVVLGSVTFQELEVPEKAEFGGKQMLAVHKMPGGMRVIDSMGRDDLDIGWSGILEGPNATSRALQIDQLRIAGQQIQLNWDMLTWTVVVSEFIASYVHRNWIPYQLKCVVVMDNSGNFAAPSFLPQWVQDDLNSAISTVLPIANDVVSAINVAQDALSVVGVFVKGGAKWNAALADLSSAQSAVQDVISVSSGQLGGVANGLSGIAGILGATRVASAITNLASFSSATGNLAGALAQQGYINRATTNLANSTSG